MASLNQKWSLFSCFVLSENKALFGKIDLVTARFGRGLFQPWVVSSNFGWCFRPVHHTYLNCWLPVSKFTIFALICWFPGTQKPILEIQVTSKTNGGFNPPPPSPIIYLDTWISNIDFLYTGNQRINANTVNN